MQDKGLTLVEFLIVISIIGILVSAVIVNVGNKKDYALSVVKEATLVSLNKQAQVKTLFNKNFNLGDVCQEVKSSVVMNFEYADSWGGTENNCSSSGKFCCESKKAEWVFWVSDNDKIKCIDYKKSIIQSVAKERENFPQYNCSNVVERVSKGVDKISKSITIADTFFSNKDFNFNFEFKISNNSTRDRNININLDKADFFGNSLSIYANTLAVGVYNDDDGGDNRGAVYIYKKEKGSWVLKSKISNNSTLIESERLDGVNYINIELDDGDSFGDSVSVKSNNLIVGAIKDDDGGANKGAVYVFRKAGNSWLLSSKISNNSSLTENEKEEGVSYINIDLDVYDYFGKSISLDGSLLAVGVSRDDDSFSNAGAVYIFQKENGIFIKKLKISNNGGGVGNQNIDLEEYEYFGQSVDLYGDYLAVGATGHNNSQGAVYVFEKIGDKYSQKFIFSSDSEDLDTRINLLENDRFGESVFIDKGLLLVGSTLRDEGGLINGGAVYLLKRGANGWNRETLAIPNISIDSYDYFGRAIDFQNGVLAIGADGDDDGGIQKGAVYIINNN